MLTVSPLLSEKLVYAVSEKLNSVRSDKRIQSYLDPLPLDQKIHVLRFLLLRGELSDAQEARIYALWRKILPAQHVSDSETLREALWQQSKWWNAFGPQVPAEQGHVDALEAFLDKEGHRPESADYFLWVALHPPFVRLHGIWDEHRRGALTSIARYAYSRPEASYELPIARHLDDWINMQTDALDILAAMKSSVLPRLAPWYKEHDSDLYPFLEEALPS